jgi:hypothetical protein
MSSRAVSYNRRVKRALGRLKSPMHAAQITHAMDPVMFDAIMMEACKRAIMNPTVEEAVLMRLFEEAGVEYTFLQDVLSATIVDFFVPPNVVIQVGAGDMVEGRFSFFEPIYDRVFEEVLNLRVVHVSKGALRRLAPQLTI